VTAAASDEPALKSANLQKLLKRGRSAVFDWFPSDSFGTGLAEILAAMANSQGGMILIGIETSGTKISGVNDSADVVDRVLQTVLSIQPVLIIPLPQVIRLEDKSVVIVQIPARMPHVYALDGRYLYRDSGTNAPLNPRDLRRLLLERGEFSFETAVTPSAGLDDLDWEKVGVYVGSLGIKASPEQTLLRRGCLTHTNDKLRPTNAGILLFGKDPQRFIQSAEITAVRFAGVTMGDTFSRQDIIGTLPDQIRRAETFLVDHLRKDVALQHTMERKERYEYPMEAARELVVNAVAHRDYSISGDGIRLFIFKDHLEVSSPGGLPGPVTIANIKDERFSRNPVIVQVLSDMGFIERLGYGVDRVIELMRQQSLRAPEFRETGGGFRVVLYNDDVPPTKESIERPAAPELILELVGEYDGLPVNPRQEAALAYLKQPGNARIINSELQRLFPEVHAETIRRDLADLVTKHILNKMGEKRGSYYVMRKPEIHAELQSE